MTMEAGKQSTYYDNYNKDLLYRIPDDAKHVIDVGCGCGALGEQYKRINPSSFVIGIERQHEAAKIAKKRLDFVIESNLEQEPGPKLPAGVTTIDCLVYGDVLEHVYDPLSLLRRQCEWLSTKGIVVASIPNVQHWSTFANLLNGEWPQQESGLFDATHVRWFTRKSAIELFRMAGLIVHDVTPRVFKEEKAIAFTAKLLPALKEMNIDPNELFKGISPLQYIIRAGKGQSNPILISGLLMRPQAGMNEVRMINPLRSIVGHPGVIVETSHEGIKLLPADSEIPRVLIWQRQQLTFENSLKQLRAALNAGYVLVSEFDDDPDHWPEIAANKNLNFTAMHGVQTSTAPLAAKLRQINPETIVFANAISIIPPRRNQWHKKPSATNPLRLFFGALNREADWKPWINAINETITQKGQHWHVEVMHDKLFFDSLRTHQKSFTPTSNYGQYLETMGKCHIAFLPLLDTPFNRMKSDLKYVEAAGSCLAVLASPTVYSTTIQKGLTGEIFTTAEELQTILIQWQSDPMIAFNMAKKAQAWVQENRLLCQQSKRREAWYRELWQRRDELHTAILKRVPELVE